jgi:endo-1,4-beta-xylanase
MTFTRRQAGTLIAGGLTSLVLPFRGAPSAFALNPPRLSEGLGQIAARNGLQYGCMVRPWHLIRGLPLADAILREAGMLVPEIELKWGVTEVVEGQPDYSRAEIIARFAARHRLALRGHTGFWYGSIPAWARRRMTGPEGHELVLGRIDHVVRHFAGRIVEWDVVNEAVEPKDGRPDGLRLAPFGDATGTSFLADCFHTAHAADPAARLYYNDYGLESDWPADEAKRRAVINLLGALKWYGAPVHGFGTQSHSACGRRFTPSVYRDFLAEVAAMGLEIRVTELDCSDYRLPPMSVAERDNAIAKFTGTFLDTVLDEPAVRGVMTWGLGDANSWLRFQKWAQPKSGYTRPLPLDDSLWRKPMWQAMARSLANAPPRAPWLLTQPSV